MRLTLAVDGQALAVRRRALGGERHDVTLGEQRWTLAVYAQGERITVFAPDGSRGPARDRPDRARRRRCGRGGRLTAPMPGKVIAFLAQVGDRVKRGQPLAVMEAMKMEHTIAAPRDGTVAELLYAVGDQVAEGGELLRLEAAT